MFSQITVSVQSTVEFHDSPKITLPQLLAAATAPAVVVVVGVVATRSYTKGASQAVQINSLGSTHHHLHHYEEVASRPATMETGGAFRLHYEQAIRVEENVDWSVHSIDYHLFKRRLTFFTERRARLRRAMATGGNGVSESTLVSILGPKSHHTVGVNETYGGYIQFADSSHSTIDPTGAATTTGPPVSSVFVGEHAPTTMEKELNRRSVLRRVSNAERNEVTVFLTFEMDKVAVFYMAQWDRLSQVLIQQGPSEQLGNEILELLAYCTINILAARQTLIRYDAFARTYGGSPLLRWYQKKHSAKGAATPTDAIVALANRTNSNISIGNYSNTSNNSNNNNTSNPQSSLRKVLRHEELNALAHTYCVEYAGPLDRFRSQWNRFQHWLESSQKK